MSTVNVYKMHDGTYYLVISTSGLVRHYEFERLIYAIEAATTLMLHIDNIHELPLNQYRYVNEAA